MKQDMIVILDLGSHENTVVARAIRALGVYSEIYPHDITAAELKALPNVKGIIINGGPNNVIDGVAIDVATRRRMGCRPYQRRSRYDSDLNHALYPNPSHQSQGQKSSAQRPTTLTPPPLI